MTEHSENREVFENRVQGKGYQTNQELKGGTYMDDKLNVQYGIKKEGPSSDLTKYAQSALERTQSILAELRKLTPEQMEQTKKAYLESFKQKEQ